MKPFSISGFFLRRCRLENGRKTTTQKKYQVLLTPPETSPNGPYITEYPNGLIIIMLVSEGVHHMYIIHAIFVLSNPRDSMLLFCFYRNGQHDSGQRVSRGIGARTAGGVGGPRERRPCKGTL